jgi:hypothetical protein
MRKKVQLAALAVAFLSLVAVVVGLAPGTVADLDGNSIGDHSIDDWDLLNGTRLNGDLGSAGNSIIRTFVEGGNPPRVFTQGGSKDPNDTTQWKWKASETTPDKDAITNTYAALYKHAATQHTILFFGGERFATNGDANIGFWFFQQNVAPLDNFTFGPGKHQNGDIFAVSAFTKGGTNPTISVYKWNDACARAVKDPLPAIVGGVQVNDPPETCAESNLELQFASVAGSSCLSGSSDTACAATNSSDTITVAWPYLSKFGSNSHEVPPSGFFEGGIDITELFGGTPGDEPCISSFLMETRSAQTPSSQLKDFVSGGFNTCGEITIHKDCACDHVLADGSAYQYNISGSVTNTGQFTPLFDVVVSDTVGGTTLTCNVGTVAAGATVTWGAGTAHPCSPGNTFNSSQKPASNTATVTWARQSGGTTLGPNSSGLVTCATDATACNVSSGIEVTKVCTTSLVADSGIVKVRVDFEGDVENKGNLPLTGVSVCEDDDSNNLPGVCDQTFSIGTLAVAEKKHYSGFYFPSVVTPTSPGRAVFSDTVKATADKPPLVDTAPSDTETATCLICPPGSAACPAPQP